MKLREYEGKKIFEKYNVAVPDGVVIKNKSKKIGLKPPLVIKAQTLSGDRHKAGGILFAKNLRELRKNIGKLLGAKISNELVTEVLVEKQIKGAAEYYCSISFDTKTRGPVLAISRYGGSGVTRAHVFPIDVQGGLPGFFIREAIKGAKIPSEDIAGLSKIISALWQIIIKENALLAEINPLIKIGAGQFVAADAKIIIDDEKMKPNERRFIDMNGDIAILASGGGASLLNIDALMLYGGKPANYTEYSGNPPAEVVAELTRRVLKKPGLKGCWVIGGTANFTDIYETMRGFLQGLNTLRPKPKYPFVIRRDGPNQKEAFAMLQAVAKKEGYKFYTYGSETAMAKTAKIIVEHAYGNTDR